jgi:hypothetical protein
MRQNRKGETVKRKVLYFVTFAVGLSVGLIAGYELPRNPRSPADQQWTNTFNEVGDHTRVMAFEDALMKDGIRRDPVELSKQLETQIRIEDLIIKDREAEYAKFTPFNALIATGLSAIGGLIGGLIAIFANKRRAPEAPNR